MTTCKSWVLRSPASTKSTLMALHLELHQSLYIATSQQVPINYVPSALTPDTGQVSQDRSVSNTVLFNTVGATEVLHDNLNSLEVEACSSKDCHQIDLNYPQTTMSQIKTLIENSESCQQLIKVWDLITIHFCMSINYFLSL